MAKVELQKVSKSYDKIKTINNIDLKVSDKEFLVLVGPSGCGKSTILRMIAGLEDITDGNILIGEDIVNEVHPKDRNIAMVFQNYALYPHMNVYDNMAFGLKMRKFSKEEIEKRVLEAAKILDLEQYFERKPKQLSGGQRQRVALGRAIVRDPQVFLMDEPLSNLDAKLRVQMRSEIKKLHQRLKTTFIYVTHDQVEALTMGDRIVILDKGVIQQIDTPENVYNKPENIFVAGFIGSPAMNFVEVTIKNEQELIIANQNLEIKGELSEIIKHNNLHDKKAILGIRPEHFSCDSKDCTPIKLTPTLIEMLGSEQLVHFDIAGKSLTAKLSPDIEVQAGTEITLSLDTAKTLLFDPDTEKSYKAK